MFVSRPELAMEGLQPVATLPRRAGSAPFAGALGWLRERVATTPGRLALISALLVVGAVGFGVIATVAERSRAQAAQAVRAQTESLLVQAVKLYTALADANATATHTFLIGGLEPPDLRADYVKDLGAASDSLATLTREVGGSAGARTAVVRINEQLPEYSGLVEAARANNRQGYPVGAAYLRDASAVLTGASPAVLTGAILPEAARLYAVEAERLRQDYGTGTATAAFAVLIAVAVLALAALIATQVYLARISRRTFNVPMLVATAVLTGVSIWAVVGLVSEQNALNRAQRDGSDSVEVLSATRVLVSRAQSDENLILVNHGSDELDPKDLARVMKVLAPPSGLIGEAQALARRTGTTAAATRLRAEFESFAASPNSNSLAGQLSTDLTDQIGAAQSRFKVAAADATSSLSGLSIAIPVFTVLAAGLALFGMRQRLGEYR
jgi:hypothetical protein